MFYDLEQPMRFVDDIVRVLDDEEVWVFEQTACRSCSRPTPTTRFATSTWSATRSARSSA
jgi:hypothetical protein